MSVTPAPQPVTARTPARARTGGGVHVLLLCTVVIGAFSAFVLVGLGGWDYYTTPAAVRGYALAHATLRPAGRIGHLFGVAGFLMLLVPIAYSVRKKARWLRNAGSMPTWLQVHVFCGVVGPALITYHTSFKFNGIVSVAYWSMVAVVLSGFVGRYLFVRIPRSLRGLELTQGELDARARELGEQLAATALPDALVMEIDTFERRVATAHDHLSYNGLFWGEIEMRREIRRFRRTVNRHGIEPALHHQVIEVAAEHATLVRRMAFLNKTKRLFAMWHVLHMPLVYIMFAIVAVHVAFTMYLGYVPFMD